MKKLFRYILWIALILFLSVVITIGGFLVYATIHDFKPGPEEKTESLSSGPVELPPARTFSAIIWNIGYGGLDESMDFFYDGGEGVRPGKGKYAGNIKSIVDFISKHDGIDFWLLQEVDTKSKRSYHDNQIIRIRSALPKHVDLFAPNYAVKFVPVPVGNALGKVNSGLLSMLAYMPESTYRFAFDKNYNWPLSIFMPDRCFMMHRFSIKGSDRKFILINTHNSAFDDGSLRAQQLATLKRIIAEEYQAGNYVLACGDWNMNPPGFNNETIATGDRTKKILPSINLDFFPDNWNIVFDSEVPTNRDVGESYVHGKTATTIIDFFICSPNIEPLEVMAFDLKFRHSDHNPVMLVFRMDIND